MIIELTIFTVVFAIIVSKLEIQIEGNDGWAKNLPTWRNTSNIYTKLTGKSLTGYHLWLCALVAFAYHSIFLFGAWSLSREIVVVGFISLFFVLEDFLWFVFNPHYGIKKFNAKHISWHTKWLGGLPIDYYWGIGLFIVAIIFS